MPIDWLTWGAAALAGLMGGVHCAAMCGGIATGFSGMANSRSWRQALEPNLGRITGYVAAGAIVGTLGQGFVQLARSPALAAAVRIGVGMVLVVVAVRLLGGNARLGLLPRRGAGLWATLRPLQRALVPANTAGRRFALGMLWGWMPCGLSSTVLVAAWLQADALNAAGTMAAFGLGTLPVMLPLTWSGARLGQWLNRRSLRSLAGGLVLFAGLLTMSAPWLMQSPALHGLLSALGCQPLQS
jgi:sulfite exporter TauE/SafE